MAAALSGASVRQLGYWRQASASGEPILVPEISAVRPLLYSFRDVVALRTCVYLRKGVSLQRIRVAIDTLHDIGEVDHLSQYKLVVQGNSVVLLPGDDSTAIDLVDRPGQQVTVIVMADVLRPFKVDERLTVPDLLHPRRSIEVDPDVRGGHPVVSGTRVPFDIIAGLVRDGVSLTEVADFYPSVDASAAADAVDFADYVDHYDRRTSSAA
jgi:uncharacterized protein (DUF433 family)/DNA-binding transcriptional MerR regulator